MQIELPDCSVHTMEQRSPEWFDIRRGRLTASQFGDWLFKADKRAESARKTAICKILADVAQCDEPPEFDSWAMQRGRALEPEAVRHWSKMMTGEVEPVGFCASKYGPYGCSPDGLILNDAGEWGGIEIKCPVPTTHIRYVLDHALPDQYKAQVHGSMAVTGAREWWFMSYCPGMPSLILYVERDDYTEKLAKGLQQFGKDLVAAQRKMAGLWEDEVGKNAKSDSR